MTADTVRILVSDPIAADGVERLRAAGEVEVSTGLTPEALKLKVADIDALVVRSETKVTAEILGAAPRLRVVGRAGVGVDNIDLEAATRHGVLVINAPTGNTIAAAEHTVGMMLAMARNIGRTGACTRVAGIARPSWASSCATGRWASSVWARSDSRSPASPRRACRCG
jgi:D-3-phosphoglycerate dehydrogenase